MLQIPGPRLKVGAKTRDLPRGGGGGGGGEMLVLGIDLCIILVLVNDRNTLYDEKDFKVGILFSMFFVAKAITKFLSQ